MISILLASYNGEKYIAEQIDSLLNQTFQEFKLIICDDKSTDNTLEIITDYARKYPDKIFVYQNEKNSGQAKINFIKMMIKYKDEYVMLCDQDDVWLPEKVEKSLAKIQELERVYGKGTPILVHTDLMVVDKDLKVLSNSYTKMSRTNYKKNKLNNLMTRNVAAGCTQIYNKTLANLLFEEPKFLIIHDWWTTMVASAFGEIETIYEPTILYRQHGNNSIGAKKTYSIEHLCYRISNHKKWRKTYNDTYRQAASFLEIYKDKLTKEQRKLLTAYSSMPKYSAIGKMRLLIKHKTVMYGIRKLGQMFIIFTESRHRK